MVPLAFLVIIGTVVFQSLTAKTVASWLKVRDPAPAGYLILGGGLVARMLAKALAKRKLRVLIADSDWDHISQARMDGIETFYGNPVSDVADRYLDLSGIGRLITLSGRSNYDVLTALHFRREFGANNIFELPSSAEGQQKEKHRIAGRLRGKHLFGEDVTHNQVLGMLRDGWTLKTTGLTEAFGVEEYLEQYAGKALMLFAEDPDGRVRLVTDSHEFTPGAGWQVTSLVREGRAEKAEKSEKSEKAAE